MTERNPVLRDAIVLSMAELTDAIIAGARTLDMIPEHLRAQPLDAEVVFAENGALLKFSAQQLNATPATETRVTAARVDGVEATIDEPILLKQRLSEVLERPPSISTIRAWSQSQRAEVLAWTRRAVRAAKNGREIPAAPEFVRERARRGSRATAAAEQPTSTTTLVSSGQRASQPDVLYDGQPPQAAEAE